jgi:hypothetical protein
LALRYSANDDVPVATSICIMSSRPAGAAYVPDAPAAAILVAESLGAHAARPGAHLLVATVQDRQRLRLAQIERALREDLADDR